MVYLAGVVYRQTIQIARKRWHPKRSRVPNFRRLEGLLPVYFVDICRKIFLCLNDFNCTQSGQMIISGDECI